MARRTLLTVLRFVFAVPLVALLVPCMLAQVPNRLQKCLPYPTLAQEIRDMQPAPTEFKVHVVRVEFDANDTIPANTRSGISTELRTRVVTRDADAPDLDEWAKEIAEVDVRNVLQNQGFFRAMVEAKLTLLRREGADISVEASISATPGPQYRLGDLRIEPVDSNVSLITSAEILRGLVPLQRRELLNIERIRTGLLNITRAYAREGYINTTVEPEFQIDEAEETIDMVLKIDQSAQYRVGSIEFLGVNAATREKLLASLPNPGEVFDGTRLAEFFKSNRAILPADVKAEEDVKVVKDVRARTVAISFDLRSCPTN